MTKTIQLGEAKGYKTNILGYVFTTIELDGGYITYLAPMGKNLYDQKMFDELVYNEKDAYQGKTINKKIIRDRIKKYIKKYKYENPEYTKYPYPNN